MAITTISYLRFIPDPIGSRKLYPLSALLYVPLLATNVLATGLICYKAWYVLYLTAIFSAAYGNTRFKAVSPGYTGVCH